MAKYTVDHVCGHQHTHNLTGPHRNRQWRLERLAEELCPACQDAARERARAEENAKNATAAEKAGLPKLEGTDKQVAWAETIRAGLVKEFARLLIPLEQSPVAELVKDLDPADLAHASALADRCEEHGLGEVAQLVHSYVAVLTGKRSASWWIDNRDRTLRQLPALLAEEGKTAEARRAKELEREEIESYRESVRRRLYDLFPDMRHWKLKVGTWGGCKRVYFGGGYGKNFAALHVTGDKYRSPGSLEGGGKDEDKKAALHAILAEVAAKWDTIEIHDSRKE